jgi:thiol-disulfide isomerase/thioredoxin
MARKNKTRKSKPVAGRLMRALDVSTNDKSKINKFLDMVKSGRTIIVLVYANWCGHCHTFKPRFDKAANSGNSQVAASIESEALPGINAQLPKPISVDGYPSLIVVGDKGNQVAPMNTPQGEEKEVVSVLNNTMKKINSVSAPKYVSNKPVSIPKLNTYESEITTVKPPSVQPLTEEVIAEEEPIEELSASEEERRTVIGGSLYGAIGAAAVQLAPAGILLGIHSLMKKRKGKTSKRGKKNMRRRRSVKRR